MIMTDDQIKRLSDKLDALKSEVSDLKTDLAVLPKDIKLAIQGMQLKYAMTILGAVTMVGWYCLQVVIPQMVTKLIGG